MNAVRVLRPGLQTTVQDAGRWGWQAMGVPVAGAMDLPAYRLANALVGNPPGAAALEVAFTGPELEFDDDRLVSATGARFDVRVNGRSVPMGEPFIVPAGSSLTFGERKRGARAYVAIAGGIDVPIVLGSRSTHLPSRLGGINGRALVAGDVLPLGVRLKPDTTYKRALLEPDTTSPRVRLKPDTTYSSAAHATINAHVTLRVLPGRHVSQFTGDPLEVLQSAPYTVGVASNRMGFRLEGPSLAHRGTADILSEITPMGTLQVPAGGLPILLMADRQTTGGYTVAATVVTADLPFAAQLAPGDSVRFTVCNEEEAYVALASREAELQEIERAAHP